MNNPGKCKQCTRRRVTHAGFCSEECARTYCVRSSTYVILKPADRRRKGGKLRE